MTRWLPRMQARGLEKLGANAKIDRRPFLWAARRGSTRAWRSGAAARGAAGRGVGGTGVACGWGRGKVGRGGEGGAAVAHGPLCGKLGQAGGRMQWGVLAWGSRRGCASAHLSLSLGGLLTLTLALS